MVVNTMDEVKEYARALGIKSLSKYKKKGDLIHTIQLTEGNTDCFGTIPDCTLDRCKWFGDCKDGSEG